MSLWVFPSLGAAVVFLVVLPVCSLAAWALLALLPPGRDPLVEQEGSWRIVLLVVPTIGPLLALSSAAIHAARHGGLCALHHMDGRACQDSALFAVVLAGALALATARWLFAREAPSLPSRDLKVKARLQSIVAKSPQLASLQGQISAVERPSFAACTRGLLSPRIELDAALIEQLSDGEVQAILLHEAEHARAKDGLRVFLARLALSMNPLACLLRPELARYRFAREALSDRRAVERGADPLALARALVVAARGPASAYSGALSTLTGAGIGGVQLRVQLLLGYAAARPKAVPQRWPLSGLLIGLTLAVLAPHVLGASALNALHHGVEQLAAKILNG